MVEKLPPCESLLSDGYNPPPWLLIEEYIVHTDIWFDIQDKIRAATSDEKALASIMESISDLLEIICKFSSPK